MGKRIGNQYGSVGEQLDDFAREHYVSSARPEPVESVHRKIREVQNVSNGTETVTQGDQTYVVTNSSNGNKTLVPVEVIQTRALRRTGDGTPHEGDDDSVCEQQHVSYERQ